ncbi:hypothetical protein GALL_392930 [mine drainage metagenome]|jgi:hypothetical protein|uniref:Uncharacterized protein n=1 Tax=mine drainage metagenome TaxID=410659 RepID=A0A1J5QSW2_9ZZZZ
MSWPTTSMKNTLNTPTSTMLSATLCGLLCLALTGCGGKHDAEPADDAGYTHAPTTGTAAPAASRYTGFYAGFIGGRSSMVSLLIDPDGRISGYLVGKPLGHTTAQMLPISALWPSHGKQATLELSDAAGQPLGRLELDAVDYTTKRILNVTLTGAHGGQSEKGSLDQGFADFSLATRGSMTPNIVVSTVSNHKVVMKSPTGKLNISREDSIGDIEVSGTIHEGTETLELHANLRPTKVLGAYSAHITTTSIVNGQSSTVEMTGHAYAEAGVKGKEPPHLLIGGTDSGRFLYLTAQGR